MKLKLNFVLLFLGLGSFGITLKAQSLSNPVAAPYYGTAKYPYWVIKRIRE